MEVGLAMMSLGLGTTVGDSTLVLAGFCSDIPGVFLAVLRVWLRFLTGAPVSVSRVWVILLIPK